MNLLVVGALLYMMMMMMMMIMLTLSDEGVSEMTSCSNQAVAMAAVTLRSRVRQMREDLQQLRAAQLDCCNCIQRGIDEAVRNIEVGAVNIKTLSNRHLIYINVKNCSLYTC